MTITLIDPAETQALLEAGARLVDIRDADEHARERIAGATNLPLGRIGDLPGHGRAVVFHCRSGMRTGANAARLAEAARGADCYILDGGIDAWRASGRLTVADRSQPLEIMRQVQIAAGALVLAGVLLGLFVGQGFLGLSAFIGAGLMFAGATGWCGMASLLRVMPWNRRRAASPR